MIGDNMSEEKFRRKIVYMTPKILFNFYKSDLVRKVKTKGIPEDAELVDSGFIEENGCFYLVVEHESFEPVGLTEKYPEGGLWITQECIDDVRNGEEIRERIEDLREERRLVHIDVRDRVEGMISALEWVLEKDSEENREKVKVDLTEKQEEALDKALKNIAERIQQRIKEQGLSLKEKCDEDKGIKLEKRDLEGKVDHLIKKVALHEGRIKQLEKDLKKLQEGNR